jgi:uncharacterized membrane protein
LFGNHPLIGKRRPADEVGTKNALQNTEHFAINHKETEMKIDGLLKLAVSSLIAGGALAANTSALAANEPGMEQCAGIIKAGKNDCATSTNACHGHVTTDANPEAWIYVPAGTCERLVGARVVKVDDPTPKKK